MSESEREPIAWRFFGFRTPAGGKIVQEWFDGLPDNERDELADTLAYLQHLRIDQWEYPNFKRLGDNLSEVRADVPSTHVFIRVYGTFAPRGQRFSYTLLYGVKKKRKNDQHGKQEAERNMRLLEAGEASVHEFIFSGESDRAPSQGKGKTIPIR